MALANEIADAIVAGVQALALVSSAAVVRRKTPSLPHGETPPGIVVTVGPEEVEHLTATTNLVRYPCSVTIITAGGKRLADDATVRNWRESIRQKLDDQEKTTFSGVSEVNRVSSSGQVSFDIEALHADLNYSVLLFTVEAVEAKA